MRIDSVYSERKLDEPIEDSPPGGYRCQGKNGRRRDDEWKCTRCEGRRRRFAAFHYRDGRPKNKDTSATLIRGQNLVFIRIRNKKKRRRKRYPINDEDALEFVPESELFGCYGDRIKKTKSHGLLRFCVMARRTDDGEPIPNLTHGSWPK